MNETCQASEWQSALRLSFSSWLHDDHECTILVNFFVFKGGSLDETATATYKPEPELTGRHTHHTGTTNYILVIKMKGSSRAMKASRRKRKGATNSRRVTASFRTGIPVGEAHVRHVAHAPSEKKREIMNGAYRDTRNAYLPVTLIRESEWRHGLSLSLIY